MIVITAKSVQIFLILALTAFLVSTIVLAVQKSNLKSDLNAAQKLLDEFEEAVKLTTIASTSTTDSSRSTDSSTTTTEKTPEIPETIDYRLPKTMTPELYDLYLHPNLETGEFEGQLVITIKVLQKTDKIILHSANLDIAYVYFKTFGQTVKNYSFDMVRDFLIVESTYELEAGTTVDLGLNFRGYEMHSKIVGLYTSTYKKADGSDKRIFTSKFQPTYARQAFPCFDEPGFKAKFVVSLVHPKDGNYHALSNMDEYANDLVGEYRQVTFKESVPMSSYLACFLISDFVAESKQVESNGIGKTFPVSVYATPEQKEKVTFALDTAKAVTEYYIKYFQVEYPLPKLDMAAIPDFVSGAMEHWGLITYRETALLYDKDQSSTVNKQRVAQTVAHEIAHMWFGNLVTLEWWDDLWLNEGFARFIEYKGQNDVYPGWKMPEQFLVNAIQPVMKFDSTLASHPIVQSVNSPAEITELFDTISYEKGASVIRMLENFIGEENFETAVTNYLETYKFNNTVTDDFLSEIEKLGLSIDVKEILRTWTEQRGFPVVNVKQTSPTTYVLTQKVFLANKEDHALINEDDTDFKYRWSIPITYYIDGVEQELKWFDYDKEELKIELSSSPKWLKINNKQIGYYRVNYDKEMWVNFASLLNEKVDVMSTSDRAQILNDVFSLADANEIKYDVAFDMMSYLEAETQYVPWKVAATKLSALKRALMFTEDFKAFKAFAKNAVEKIYKDVGWDVKDEDMLENRLRMTVLSSACSLGVEGCVKEATKRFEDFLNKKEKPHPDLREVVYYYGMASSGSEVVWDQLWYVFIEEQDANEKAKLMEGLSAIQVPWILKRFVDLAWNPDNVREQDYFTCIQGIAANPVGEAIVWEYVRENWEKMVSRFGINNRYLGRMIPAVVANFDSETKLGEVLAFFEKYPDTGAGASSRQQAVANINGNIQWMKSNLNDIRNWLENYSI